MQNETERPMQPTKASTPFKKWTECEKAFRGISLPISNLGRDNFLARLNASEGKRYFAFRFLVNRAVGDRAGKLAPFEDSLMAILSEGQPFVRLEELTSREAVASWINENLCRARSKEEARDYLNRYEHLWVLYLVLRTWHQEPVFTAALHVLSRCIARFGATKKIPAKEGPEGLENFVRSIARKVPEKPILGKGLKDLLTSARSLIALSSHFADDLVEKTRALEKLSAEHIDSLREAEEFQAEISRLRSALDESAISIRQLQQKLGQEQEHFERQKGVHEEVRKKMMSDILSELRRSCLPRLENMRLFADREEANKEGILRLAREMTDILNELK